MGFLVYVFYIVIAVLIFTEGFLRHKKSGVKIAVSFHRHNIDAETRALLRERIYNILREQLYIDLGEVNAIPEVLRCSGRRFPVTPEEVVVSDGTEASAAARRVINCLGLDMDFFYGNSSFFTPYSVYENLRQHRTKHMHDICLQIFRNISQKVSETHQVFPVFFVSSDEKFADASTAQALRGIALKEKYADIDDCHLKG